VHMHVLFPVTGVGKLSVTPFNLALKWFLAGMNSFMNLQVFRASKRFSTGRKWTGERFLSGMNSYMVDEFILGFKPFLLPLTVVPVTSVICDLRSSHMFNREVVHNIVEGVEEFVAHLLSVLVDPLTHHVLLYRFPHVPVVRRHVSVAHVVVVVGGRGGRMGLVATKKGRIVVEAG